MTEELRILDKKIKNLQVSISIAKREKETLLSEIKTAKGEDRQKKLVRIAQLEKIITTKTTELEPLKVKRGPRSGNRSRIQVSEEEIAAVAKKYKIAAE